MAIYTIIAADERRKPRACWMLDAPTSAMALSRAWTLREQGMMPWLPADSPLSVRKASIGERQKYTLYIKGRPVGGPDMNPDDVARRTERLARSFFEKLYHNRLK